MIKVIGGKYRSRVLDTPPSEITLPSKNMVRGALISMAMPLLNEARVLDLFAGSGALGIEAISQGARHVDFVDDSPNACKVISNNLSKLKIEDATLIQSDYMAALNRLKGNKYQIVFLDPPYAKKEAYQKAIDFLLSNSMLDDNSVVFCEYEGEIEVDPSPFARVKTYNYGKTRILSLWRQL